MTDTAAVIIWVVGTCVAFWGADPAFSKGFPVAVYRCLVLALLLGLSVKP